LPPSDGNAAAKHISAKRSISLASGSSRRLGITINSIAPGAIETPINKKLLNDPVKLKSLLENIPLKRLGKPEDVASVAAFLASSDADYVTGTTYFIDGGLNLELRGAVTPALEIPN
jgi:NAD(P)-dependent dehydrogenase (short-subunit alcohol dehydrogenase family)